jgi:predicted TIM-barrel fold metal-dependent hydrolase
MGSLHYDLDAIELIKSYPNVFTDTSGMTSPIILRRAVYECGAKKLLFGSDYPFWHPEVEICRIYASGFTKQDELAILGENAARVFNL